MQEMKQKYVMNRLAPKKQQSIFKSNTTKGNIVSLCFPEENTQQLATIHIARLISYAQNRIFLYSVLCLQYPNTTYQAIHMTWTKQQLNQIISIKHPKNMQIQKQYLYAEMGMFGIGVCSTGICNITQRYYAW